MKYQMTYSLHEEKGGFLEQICGDELDDLLSEEARKNLNYAFYEVIMNVEIDTETGDVKILEIV